jgi:spore coat protein U-like protein
MSSKILKSIGAILLLLSLSSAAFATTGTITCKTSSPVYTATYTPFAGSTNNTSMMFDMTCSRPAAVGETDAATVKYAIRSNNGSYPSGGANRARHTTQVSPFRYVAYDLYTDASCTIPWQNGANDIEDALVLTSGVLTATKTYPFYGCIGAGQNTVVAGTHKDAPNIVIGVVQVRAGINVVTGTVLSSVTKVNGTVDVTINVAKECIVSTQPGNLVFGNYAAFGPAMQRQTPFGTNCTNLATYTMALDTNSGVIAGLNYNLALSATGGTSGGIEQLYTITANIPAGQAGSCAAGGCTTVKSKSHTLTITY